MPRKSSSFPRQVIGSRARHTSEIDHAVVRASASARKSARAYATP